MQSYNAQRSINNAASVPSLAQLSDPPMRFVDGAMMDYFVIEMVEALKASSKVASARSKKLEEEMVQAGLLPKPPAVNAPSKISKRDSQNSINSKQGKEPLDQEEEELRTRLDAIGHHVGANFTERRVPTSALYFLKLNTA